MRGQYFTPNIQQKQTYDFGHVKHLLPEPILDHPNLIDMYWFTVQCAFRNAKNVIQPTLLVADYQDSAFNQNIFLWDSVFISRFLTYFNDFLPGIRTLDNFYARQHTTGLIPREIHKLTGEDFPKWLNPLNLPLHSYFHRRYRYRGLNHVQSNDLIRYYNLQRQPKESCPYTLDALNHPILGYAEYQHYVHTGDIKRLTRIHDALYHHYDALYEHLRHQSNLFVTDWASMDNSTRNDKLFLGIDISSEMVMFAKDLMKIYTILQDDAFDQRINRLKSDIDQITFAIQHYMWDPKTNFYYDLDEDLHRINIKTIAGFWPLLAGICTMEQAEHLTKWLQDPHTFYRLNVIPCLAADEKGYDPRGGYWRGGVWASTNLMVTDGLEKYGKHSLAKHLALKYLDAIGQVYQTTRTLWELYPADEISKGDSDHADFVGWTGIGPIHYLIQYRIGLKADAINRTLSWQIDTTQHRVGINRFRFFDCQADLLATIEDDHIRIDINTRDRFQCTIAFEDHSYTYHIVGPQTLTIKRNKL